MNDQRAAALRFADPRVLALLHALLLFLLVRGTFPQEVYATSCSTVGDSRRLTPGRITYDLRRFASTASPSASPETHRYRITPKGLRTRRLLYRSS